MPKVSVIVPVYNAEKTLSACLGNLVHQTLSDIELILINDASTDGSLQILLACEEAFSEKVLVVNLEENQGPGGARNVGLSYASGEYIGFVDSDDIPDVSMYEKLYHLAISGNYDMVDCVYYNEESDKLILQTADTCTGILDGEKRSELIAGGGYLWSRLFRRELFENMTFRTHTILEDMETMMLLFMRAKSLGTTRDVLYKYSASVGSASKLSNPPRYHKAICDGMRAVYHTLSDLDDYSTVQKAVEYSILHLYQGGIVNALHPDHKLDEIQRKVYLAELHGLRHEFVTDSYEDNPYVMEKIRKEDLTLMRKIDAELSQ